jgi:hypothetical protein
MFRLLAPLAAGAAGALLVCVAAFAGPGPAAQSGLPVRAFAPGLACVDCAPASPAVSPTPSLSPSPPPGGSPSPSPTEPPPASPSPFPTYVYPY